MAEVRVDLADGAAFTLQELLGMHELLGTGVDRGVVQRYWMEECRQDPADRRVDPADGRPYSLAEFRRKYTGHYNEAECQAYFGAVMPRPCPAPHGALAPSVAPRCGSGLGGGLVEAPFAAAALWAARLPEVEACDGDLRSGGTNPLAVAAALRYAMNNLRLALGALEPREAARHWPSLMGVQRASVCLESFSRQPTPEGFTKAVGSSKAALHAFGEWLAAQGPAKVQLSEQIGAQDLFPQGSPPSVTGGKVPKALLPNGSEIPLLGFGTWQMLGQEAYQATLAALARGYRHIDTAQVYQNEREVGRALRDSGIPRSEIFLSTKLSDPGCFRRARQTAEAQLRDLGVDYVDLYMLHSPADRDSVRAAWRDLETLHDAGKLRALGVSNFGLAELQDLLAFARIPPVYLQNKMNVYSPGEQRVSSESSIIAFAKKNRIVFFGYSVNNPWPNILRPMEDPHVRAVASRHSRTPAQVLLRWALQLGAGILPKSTSRTRIDENFQVLNFQLPASDMRLLTGLATLAESAGALRAPTWIDDVYGLMELNT